MKSDCIFCKIVAGEIPSNKIYEDDTAFAFLDITPINLGHTLLIPKEHHANLYDMPDDILAHMAPVIKKLAIGIKNATRAEGINIGMNNDAAAGQIVGHAHIHIMPRFADDGHEHWKGHGTTDAERADAAQRIRSALA